MLKIRRFTGCKIPFRSTSYYITTPIFYVNSSPHIGHVYTLLLADALNRFQRLKLNTHDTKFSTGTDEHGLKIQTAAEALNLKPKDFCDKNSGTFRDLSRLYQTTVTDFIRTTDDKHRLAVESFWKSLDDRGYIYKSSYSGWYCSSDETFVPESQVTKKEVNGSLVHCDQNDNLVAWSSEENYMFRLGQLEDKIRDWLKKKKPIVPEKFNNEAIKMLELSPIGDISISRPKSRLRWGIEVPGDPTQTVYVWLDALTSYLTVAGYQGSNSQLSRWPIDCQVIGKDIIKFHAIYWPAFLMALQLHLPKKLICHSHWLIDSYKMSKSRGNVVEPISENGILSVDGLRYYLLRCGTPHSDTDYSQTQALRRVNSELADTYGNLINRCCAPAINPQQTIPTTLIGKTNAQAIEICERLKNIAKSCSDHYEDGNFYKGVDDLMAILRLNNTLYEAAKPWKLVKELQSSEGSYEEYSNLQAITFETLRICSILLQPIVPNLAKRALDRIDVSQRSWEDARYSLSFDAADTQSRIVNSIGDPVLFRRIK